MNASHDATSGRPVWLHYHVPKTGGQTLRSVFIEQFTVGATYAHITAASSDHFPHTNAELAMLSMAERRQILIASGHGVDQTTRGLFEGREIHEFVVVRDPAARIVSAYNYRARQIRDAGSAPVDFDTWYATRGTNPMLRFLADRIGVPRRVDEVVDRLQQFDFVAETEQMDRWMPYLLRQLGCPDQVPPRRNVTGTDHEQVLALDPELEQRIIADHPGDVRLMQQLAPLLAEHLARAESDTSTPPAVRPPKVQAPIASAATATPTAPASNGLTHRLTAPGSRRAIQIGAVLAWLAATVTAFVSRSGWSSAAAATVAGLLALLALKVALVGVSAAESAGRQGAVTGLRRDLDQQRSRLELVAEQLRQGGPMTTGADLAETGLAHREMMLSIRDQVTAEVKQAAERVRLLERMVDPLATINQAQRQEIVALREQLDRAQAANSDD